jgi:hypothetical protein
MPKPKKGARGKLGRKMKDVIEGLPPFFKVRKQRAIQLGFIIQVCPATQPLEAVKK